MVFREQIMLYIFGKTIPVDKTILHSLTYLFGIHLYNAQKICAHIGLNPSVRVNTLKKSQIRKLIQFIDQHLMIEQDLKKEITLKKQHLITMKTYRGLRRLRGLPIRGQRTHTNSKTAKKLKK